MNIFILLDSWLHVLPGKVMTIVRSLGLNQRVFIMVTAIVSALTPVAFCIGPAQGIGGLTQTWGLVILTPFLVTHSVLLTRAHFQLATYHAPIELKVEFYDRQFYRRIRLSGVFLWPFSGVIALFLHEFHPLQLLLFVLPPFATPLYLVAHYIPLEKNGRGGSEDELILN